MVTLTHDRHRWLVAAGYLRRGRAGDARVMLTVDQVAARTGLPLAVVMAVLERLRSSARALPRSAGQP